MAIKIDRKLTPQKLVPKLERFFDLSGQKILSIEKNWRTAKGTPVFTVKGQYTFSSARPCCSTTPPATSGF